MQNDKAKVLLACNKLLYLSNKNTKNAKVSKVSLLSMSGNDN